MRLLLSLLLALAQASPEAEVLWQRGERLAALERMAGELAQRPQDASLRTLLVLRELETERFRAALEHSQGLPDEALGLRGRALYYLARYDAALTHLRLDDERELLMRAEALRALGRFEALDALLPRLREVLGAGRPEVLLLEARQALRRGELERAVELLSGVLAVRPLESEALFGLGRALLRLGRRAEGLALLERHRLLTPRLDELDFARRGVLLAPRGAANQAALGEAWDALVPFDAAAADEARAAFELALELAQEAELPPIALRCARHWRETRADGARAIEVLEAALARRDDVRLRVRAADYLVERDLGPRALGHLRRALELRPGDRAILERIAALESPEERDR